MRNFAEFAYRFLVYHWNRIVPSQINVSLSTVLDPQAEKLFEEKGIYLLVNEDKMVAVVEEGSGFNDLLILIRDSHGKFVHRA